MYGKGYKTNAGTNASQFISVYKDSYFERGCDRENLNHNSSNPDKLF